MRSSCSLGGISSYSRGIPRPDLSGIHQKGRLVLDLLYERQLDGMENEFNLQAFSDAIAARKKYVDSCLRDWMGSRGCFPPLIHEAMHYAVFNGGKRLRPIMVMEGARLAGKDPDMVIPSACALEMLHSYSLVHDDLPAMDDDDFRRGKPTCHKVFGEANAILTGDALLTAAFFSASVAKEIMPGTAPAPTGASIVFKAARKAACRAACACTPGTTSTTPS